MSKEDDEYSFRQPSITKIVVLTSLVWILFDIGLYYTFLNETSTFLPNDSCQQNVYKLEKELVKQQDLYSRLTKLLSNDRIEREISSLSSQLEIKPNNVEKSIEEFLVKGPELVTTRDSNDKSQWIKEDFSNEPTNPPEWHGENGRAVIMPENLKQESKKRFPENQFDIVASDLIALNRTIPEQRSESCQNREYPVDLPNTSIIIVYHNEGNSTLLRGLTSIVNKSPLKYLKEIILVDDASIDREYLHAPLDEFVKTLPVSVKIIRNEQRLGLMRSRLKGADAATGDTMTFLDAHIECTNGWLPPLLYEIKKNRKAVPNPIIDVISDQHFSYTAGSEKTYGGFDAKFVFHWVPVPERENMRRNGDESLPLRSSVACPVIDAISDQNFSYIRAADTNYGGFDLKLNFRWYPARKRFKKDMHKAFMPFRTPTMAGGLFIIDRKFFYEMGAYDEGMDIWGAENLEMSFRIWMCGGTLLVLPCSHVGHVFRKKTPYKFPGGTNKVIFRNTRRLIDVWTDEYAKFFYSTLPDLQTVSSGDLTDRIQLRNNLQCKSFRWYLENIYPESHLPMYYYHLGSVQNLEYNFCLDTLKRKSGEDCGASSCHGKGGNQLFEYSKKKNLISNGLCLDSTQAGVVKMNTCKHESKNQIWDYDEKEKYLKNRQTGLCLDLNELRNSVVIATNCDPNMNSQKWLFSDPMNLNTHTKNI